MLVRNANTKIIDSWKLIDPEINHEASNYIANNYDTMIKHAMMLGIVDKAGDLVSDVFTSILLSENEGNGYRYDYIDGRITTVEEFVHSRLKGYAKSDKYRTDKVDSGRYTVVEKTTVSQPIVGLDGKYETDRNGNIVYKKQEVTKKVTIKCNTYAATPSDCREDNTGIQAEYENYQMECHEIDDVDSRLSIIGSIDICKDIADMHNVNIINVIKNMDEIAETLGNTKTKRNSAEAAFEKIASIAKCNDEFATSLREILEFSMNHRDTLKEILSYM